MIIDYSAYNTWQECPAKWYEKYINKRQLKWPAQRDDALALGSLVHEGLRVWQLTHTIQIPETAIEANNPTKDCFQLAQELVYGYARAYPEELWPLILCEEPHTFPLMQSEYAYACPWCGFYHDFSPTLHPDRMCPSCEEPSLSQSTRGGDLIGLAKIDSYFTVPSPTVIQSGFGQELVLNPGWWIHEYKTKSPDIPIALYMQSWEMNIQSSFQLLALEHRFQEPVQGILINVLEKPKRYIPKRKCGPCNQYFEFYTWIPLHGGQYQCPNCGTARKLDPNIEPTTSKPPNFYRILVTRTQEELEFDKRHIISVGQKMIEMEQQGLNSVEWTKRNCVTFYPKRVCEYFGPHKNHRSTLELAEYEEVTDYRGLVQVNES